MNSRNYILYLLPYRIVFHYVILKIICRGMFFLLRKQWKKNARHHHLNYYCFLIYWTCAFQLGLVQLSQGLCFNDFMKSFPLRLWSGPVFLMEEMYLNCLRAKFSLLACCPRICETRNSIKNILNLLASIRSLGRNHFD